MAHFSVPNPLQALTAAERLEIRQAVRARLNIAPDRVVLAFFGKFIPKKNPELLFHCLPHLSATTRQRLTLLFVGAGELKPELDRLAAQAQERFGVASVFTGFINQRELPQYYLASDIVALPSRPMGEAWGLVINEALQAGCAVIMSSAVGCAPEFSRLERARVIDVEDDAGLARGVEQLAELDRDLEWAWDFMRQYSTEEAAINIASVMRRY
jgi:glycosyltransferase involved in cell wall biosynthesis